MNKHDSRLRRAKRTRKKIEQLAMPRMTVHRTPRHIYVQVLSVDAKVLAQASTLDKEVREKITASGNMAAAKVVGEVVAQRCLNNKIKQVAFDRSGFKFHGRVKALADAARESGIDF